MLTGFRGGSCEDLVERQLMAERGRIEQLDREIARRRGQVVDVTMSGGFGDANSQWSRVQLHTDIGRLEAQRAAELAQLEEARATMMEQCRQSQAEAATADTGPMLGLINGAMGLRR